MRPGLRRTAAVVAMLLPAAAGAALELGRAHVERLDNGLTLIVLEEHSFPVASVQMLYRVGARDEVPGRTGLAHFLEHMAFRASENFPDTQVVSSIYAAGGEWHGYTWTDQTTYFATVPADSLDLLLRIEADRMSRAAIDAGEVEAERGSVLAELHGYENDPAATLYDYVAFVALLAHPYRNNTIGFASDVESIERQDILEFYHRHYVPANAVLAVVGDVSTAAVSERVRELFGPLPARPATPLPRAIEPPQLGERRIELEGAGGRSYFQISYHAPSVRSPDYPAFLLLQALAGGSSGVNFRQDIGGHAVEPGSLLAGTVDDLQTWYPPAAQPYLFTLSGSIEPEAAPAAVEAAIEARLRGLRDRPVGAAQLAAARAELLEELLFDVETYEDAAHELAFFDGLHALDLRLELPERLAQVRPQQVQALARRYLAPERRTIGWYHAGLAPVPAQPPPAAPLALAGERTARPTASEAPSKPVVATLSGGLPVIVQRVPLTPSCFLRLVLAGRSIEIDAPAVADEPVWGHSSVGRRCRPAQLEESLRAVRAAFAAAHPAAPADPATITDPETRLRAELERAAGLEPESLPGVSAVLLAVVGDIDPRRTIELLEASFGDLSPGPIVKRSPLSPARRDVEVRVPRAAQAQLGYVVPAPPPADPQSLAWRLLLYVLSHDYEGRLGKEAISNRGLVYIIDARYDSDRGRAWITLATGVDPARLDAMKAALRTELEGLRRRPPTSEELAEAKAHLLGRRASATISNEEISAALATEWLWHGELRDEAELGAALQSIEVRDLERIVPAFTRGRLVTVVPQ